MVLLAVNSSQEFVIFFIGVELKRMLVVGEQAEVSVGKISQSSSLLRYYLEGKLQDRSCFQLGICNTWV